MQTRLVRIRSSMDVDVPAYLALFTAYPYEEKIGLISAGSWEKLLRRVDREGAGSRHALLFAEETPQAMNPRAAWIPRMERKSGKMGIDNSQFSAKIKVTE